MMGRSKNKVSVKLLAVIVVLIICTALFSFVGCAKDGADTSKEQTLQSVTIVNKSDFDETWYVGGASKRIKVSCSPDYKFGRQKSYLCLSDIMSIKTFRRSGMCEYMEL